jgi:anaerobic magnesium-protoporphyrin IX monomethyl ester cyclase
MKTTSNPRRSLAPDEAPWLKRAKDQRKVCLVIPPSEFLLDDRVFPSLGILKIAAVLEAGGHTVEVLDLSGIANYLDVVAHAVSTTVYDAVGITVTTPQLPSVFKIRNRIKELRPGLRLILGGAHVALAYSGREQEHKAKRIGGRASRAVQKLEENFDVLCAGDGEVAIFAAIGEAPPKHINGDDHKSELFLTDALYEAAPAPARHLIDLSTYKYNIEGFPATSLIAQLGCPFACGFCGGRFSRSLRIVRTRSHESIVAEVADLHDRYGYTGFMFYDDELNVNPKIVALMNGLAELQKQRGVEFRLRGFIKAELFTEEQAEAMYRAGFRWLLCGFEAADPRILVNIQKRATREDNTRAVELARKHGMKIKALMSVGHPGETRESIQAVRDWLIEMRVDDFDCTVITPYPGTPYHDLAVPSEEVEGVWIYTQPLTGDRLHAREVDYSTTADYYKGIPEEGYRSFVYTDHLDGDEIVQLRDELERDVRATLDIPFNSGRPALMYEHSMGQSLPEFILRKRAAEAAAG